MKVIFIFTFLILHSLTFGQKNNVKTITESWKTPKGKVYRIIKSEFDNTGFLIKKSSFNLARETKNYKVYTKDSLGNVATDTNFNNEDEIKSITLYKYNKHGDKIYVEAKFIPRNTTYIEFLKIKYDESGNKIQELQYNQDSTLGWEYVFKFNDANQKVNELSSFEGVKRGEILYKYENNLKVETIIYDYKKGKSKKKENTLYFYSYDKKGNLVKETVHSVADYLKEKIITTTNFKYNKMGLLISKETFETGKLTSEKTFEYEFHKKA